MQFIEFPKVDLKIEGMDGIRIPKFVKIRQKYDKTCITDTAAHIRSQLKTNISAPEEFHGRNLCITVGSRGIPELDVIVRTIVNELKKWGAHPHIIPAMGSHGGATAEGQRELIAAYGITEEAMGAPVISSMDVVQVGNLPDGTPVFCDKFAAESDGVVVLNKVKPHTDFRAKHESGLAKMLAIGLANHAGASQFHMRGFPSFPERIPQACRVMLDNVPIAFGVGIVQNAYDAVSRIEVVEKHHFLEKDAELQLVAKASLANFKLNDIDVLVIDEIGKNISGNGADPNITGRGSSPGFEDILNLKKLFIRGLTKETNHSGCGISDADITTRRCLNSIDFEATWINVVTSTMMAGGRIPMYQENDRDALLLAIRTCNNTDFLEPRIIRIKNTLSMEYIEVSEAFADECDSHPDIDVVSEPYELKFDAEGFMI